MLDDLLLDDLDAAPSLGSAEKSDEKGIRRIPFSFAKRNKIVVIDPQAEHPTLVCGKAISPQLYSEVRRFLQAPFVMKLVPGVEFENLLQSCYEKNANDSMNASMGDIGDDMDLASVAEALLEPADLMESEDDAPIIRLINALLTEAVKENASDIHIEPFESRLQVRFRVDGVLRTVLQPNRALAPLLVSRIKVMARLDIAEKRLPQDGRISLRVAGRAVDVRVSTIPSGHGERVVLRLLDKQAGRLDLQHLGMPASTLEHVDRMIRKPHGIVLVTGPTGSGKTTTLYAALATINDKTRNIMTVEDPIEYYLDGIGQSQVNIKVDMSFARGLRAILRQDPDVVMVGEIRDLETVQVAIQASLTGHMVFSTLHTNSAIGSITRLRDMGVEPFLLSSSLVGVVAQRLVRSLCSNCKEAYVANEADCKLLGVSPDESPTLFRPVGCKACNELGYKGRTGIYEVLEIDDKLRLAIHDGASERAIEDYARTKFPSMQEEGFYRVLEGDTSLEEILRVCAD